MPKSSWKSAGNFEAEALPQTDRSLVGADDKVELHGTEPSGLSVLERMTAHRSRHAAASLKQGSEIELGEASALFGGLPVQFSASA